MGRIKPQIIKGSPLMVVGENPNRLDILDGSPFSSGEGKTIKKLLRLAQVEPKEASLTYFHLEDGYDHVMKMFPKFTTSSVSPSAQAKDAYNRLWEEIDYVQPRVILALGKYSHWAITGNSTFDAMRGYPLRCHKGKAWVISTYSSDVLRKSYDLIYTASADIQKLGYILRNPNFELPEKRLHVVHNRHEAMNLIRKFILDKQPVAFDLETTELGCHITHVGVSNDPLEGYSLVVDTKWTLEEELEFWSAIDRLHQYVPLVYCNACFDMAVMWHQLKIWPQHYEDIQLMAHVSHLELPKSLGFLASFYLMTRPWKMTSGVDMGIYNAEDAANTLEIFQKMRERDTFKRQESVYLKEIAQVEPATFMHLAGLCVDTEKQKSYKSLLEDRHRDTLSKLKQRMREENIQMDVDKFNPNSSLQVKSLLYTHMGFRPKYSKNTRGERTETTGDKALLALARETSSDIPLLVVEYRKLQKRLSNYSEFNVSPEGKVHSSYNIGGTKTGRWASSGSLVMPYGPGNLQNIVHEIRYVFVEPDPNRVIIQLDYSTAEAVVVTYMANDNYLKSVFVSRLLQGARWDNDVHKITYARFSKVPLENISKEQRTIGKVLRHATNYEGGPSTVADSLRISLAEATELYRAYRKSDTHIMVYHDGIRNKLYQSRSLVTPLGRFRQFLGRPDDGNVLRGAYAYVPQSTIGDHLNDSMVKIYHNVCSEEVRLWAQLHDAIYLTAPKNIAHEVAWECYKNMVRPLYIGGDTAIVDVDYSIGRNWGKHSEENPDGQIEYQFDTLRKRDWLAQQGWFDKDLLETYPYEAAQ